MAAAYAALMSLLNTSELILHPSQHWFHIHRNQIESLLQKVRFLQEFLEEYSHREYQEMAGVESQIAAAANEAEDTIESYVLARNRVRSTGFEAENSTRFSQYIHKVIEEMEDLIENKLMRIKETTIGKFEEDPTFIDYSSRSAPKEQTTMVGSDEKLNEILDILTGQQSNRQMVAIVGMGGIGKTTLANNVYRHPYIQNHFHICAWATISQKYSARKIIYEMLLEIEQSRSESHDLSDDQLGQAKCDAGEEQLGEQLYKTLFGRRYLIVLDDLWSIEAWYEIKRFFPDHCNNGSRIMITTRENKVAAQLSSCRRFEMDLLEDKSSWELLSEKVFGHQQVCPPELEGLGKTIAKNCKGLPLAIVVIGGLLANSDKTMDSWKHVAGNLSSIINSEEKEKCLKILYLSYNNLPIYLKPCFLHLALAPDPYNLYIPMLIKLWVSEGIVKPMRGKSLEEAAHEYITQLVDRNLIFVRRREFLGNLVRCSVHDLLRDLCEREAKKINLFGVIYDDKNPKFISHLRIRPSNLEPKGSVPRALHIVGPASLSRSITNTSGSDSTPWYAGYLLTLRVLSMTDSILPDENSELMNLRFLSFHGHMDRNSISRFYSLMSLFWNLQTLQIINSLSEPLLMPPEIWCLPHLRHLESNEIVLPDPPLIDSHILENLQTLQGVVYFRCTEEVYRRLPNLKELSLKYDLLSPGVEWPLFHLHNLVHLHKLQSLSFHPHCPISWKDMSFPLSLKELTLCRCWLPWEDMSIVGLLPNLELLQLWSKACQGLTWCPIQGQFVKLRVLQIAETDFVHWRADNTHFPILEHLILTSLNLEEFPLDFGEHVTLTEIEIVSCGDSTNSWAEEVCEEQKSFGNEGFRVMISERVEEKSTRITSIRGHTLSRGFMIYD